MRTFQYELREELNRGLRRDDRAAFNTQALTHLLNAEAGEHCLNTYNPVTLPFSSATLTAAGVSLSWPTPRLFRGRKYTLLADADTIFRVTEAFWTLTEIDLIDYEDKSTEVTLANSSPKPWQFIDMWDTWFLLNGESVVFRTNWESMLGRASGVFLQEDVHIETGCEFRGRVLFGGFDENAFWNNQWKHFWKDWGRREANIGLDLDMPFDENFVWWSTIGGGDALWMFYPYLMMEGIMDGGEAHTIRDPIIFDYIRRNECGFMAMPWQGNVRHLIPLETGVIVIGDNGVNALIPSSGPTPTFGRKDFAELRNVGIANSGAVAGNGDMCLFVDTSGTLWMITKDMKVERLGYAEYLYDLLGNTILVNYAPDPEGWKFFIGTDSETFLFNRWGMSQVDQKVTSTDFADGGVIGYCNTAGSTDNDMELTTDILDFGTKAIKRIESIEIDTKGLSDINATVSYKADALSNYADSSTRNFNKHGFVVLPVAGIEFKIKIVCTTYTAQDPPKAIRINWTMADKRNVRSQYATIKA